VRNLSFTLIGGTLAALASCQAAPDTTTSVPATHSAATKAASASAAASSQHVGAGVPFAGYHRYRGTVGTLPVTMALLISPDRYDSTKTICSGSYYYDQGQRGLLDLSAEGTYQPQQPLRLEEAISSKTSGTWRATQPAGPLLSGTWLSSTGKQLPFVLREDYTDGAGHLMAVRYEMLDESVELPCQREEGETKAEYHARIANAPNGYDQQFLHLLGPDTLRPGLQALQCPVPRERRRLTRVAARENGCAYHSASLSVGYNEHGPISWSEYWEDDAGGSRPSHGSSATVCDLRTGGTLSLTDVLRPNTDTLLQRLITQHLLHGDNPDIELQDGVTMPARAADGMPLPGGGEFGLANDGLEFGYYIDNVSAFVGGGPLLFSVLVPYTDLLPLLRPNSPVARMLRERGLWKQQKPR
jgi:hypothetical protein